MATGDLMVHRDSGQFLLTAGFVIGCVALVLLSGCSGSETSSPPSPKEVLDMAAVAIEDMHSGRIEGELVGEEEMDDGMVALSEKMSGSFDGLDSVHLMVTHELKRSVDDGPDRTFVQTTEWVLDREYVYVYGRPEGDARFEVGDVDLPIDLSELFKFDLLDGVGEVSVKERELDGERVYYVVGPAVEGRSYPMLGGVYGEGSVSGMVAYWIGVENGLLRRFDISAVAYGERSGYSNTRSVNGFVSISGWGSGTDVVAPTAEGGDDHGDFPSEATAIAVGTEVKGSVDSWLDSDYFWFEAEEGGLYNVVAKDEPGYETQSGIRATLLGSDGVTAESGMSSRWGSYGTQILWQAPRSGTHYVKVESGRQERKKVYRLIVDLQSKEDDYGDELSDPHPLAVDEDLIGRIGHRSDRDYFSFMAEAGQDYRIELSTFFEGDRSKMVLHGPEGVIQEGAIFGGRLTSARRINWKAPNSGEYYISVELGNGVGSYTIRVSLASRR